MKQTHENDANRSLKQANRSTSEAVGREIEDLVRKGVWAPEERLPSIRSLARQFSVSAVTMNRAVRQLSARGVLRSEPRKGVYVADIPRDAAARDDIGFEIQRSFVQKYSKPRSLSIALKPPENIDIVNLASGTMAPNAVPLEAIQESIHDIAASYVEQSFSTIATDGELRLRRWVVRHLAEFGIGANPEDVVITNGSQQGRKLVADTMIEPGDTVLVEQPAYPIALSTFEAAGARCIGVPMDPKHGLRLDVLEHLAAHHRPKFLYTVSTGQIPTGLTTSVRHRERLIELAIQEGFLIVESDPGNELHYEDQPPAAIKSLDPGGMVIYLKSFSRAVAAGLRIGAAVVSGPLRDAIVNRKLTDDMVTSPLSQEVFLAYVSRPDFKQNLDATRNHYVVRRDATMAALSATMPEGVTWTEPTAGLHTWLTLPVGLSAKMIAEQAINNGVVVAHGEIFMPNDDPDNGIRITFSDNTPDRIAVGVARLANVISSSLESLSESDTGEYTVKIL